MSRITIGELRARHAELVAAREEAQRAARETDMNYAVVLGELERLIAIAQARGASKGEQSDDNASKE